MMPTFEEALAIVQKAIDNQADCSHPLDQLWTEPQTKIVTCKRCLSIIARLSK